MKIVIVGASFAGLAAALEARQSYPESEIYLIDRLSDLLYSPAAVKDLLQKRIQEFEEDQVGLWQEILASDLKLMLGYELLGLSETEQSLTLSYQGEDCQFSYDRLILALGAEQSQQLAEDNLTPYLLTFKDSQSSRLSWEKLQTPKKVLVVGAGQMGMELAAALHEAGHEVVVVEAQSGPLAKHLDSELSQKLLGMLGSQGVESHFETSVEGAKLSSSGQGVTLETATGQLTGDLLLLATNFSPNTACLPKKMRQNADGSLWVDDYLQTNLKNIWAVGDLIQLPVAYFGQSYLPMIRHSLLTGRLAANNLQGQNLPMLPVKRWVVSRFWGWSMLSLGFTERELSLWEEVVSLSHLEEDFLLKLHIRQSDSRLLGAQLLLPEGQEAIEPLLIWAIEGEVVLEEMLYYLMAKDKLTPKELTLVAVLKEGVRALKGGRDEA